MEPSLTSARFLMCPPAFFGVDYVINPWMVGMQGAVHHPAAQAQWNALHALLTRTLGAYVDLVPPQMGLPDLVFTANAGLIWGNRCVPARFHHPERQGEEPHFARWFEANGWVLQPLGGDLAFEGAGDALWDERPPSEKPRLWAGHGFRTDAQTHGRLARLLDVEVVSLRLVDDRFYHLDTCFCPLPGGHLLWYPPAFDADSQAAVVRRVPGACRLAVDEEDAAGFACNAVAVNNALVLNTCSDNLAAWLRARGFEPHTTPLSEFLKAGGAAKCLTLRLG